MKLPNETNFLKELLSDAGSPEMFIEHYRDHDEDNETFMGKDISGENPEEKSKLTIDNLMNKLL